jgi:D-alanyl-D-alanine carboxypeptidase/D-alanyl-D-alanine-endopeptidase (penicillin-binding protein 4)
VVGAGDPALGDVRVEARRDRTRATFLDEWITALKARGVTKLKRIVLDDTVFEQPGRHPDWPRDQADRWYQAPVGGLNLNDNCLDVEIAVSGQTVTLRPQPPVPLDLIRSSLRVGPRHQPVFRRPSHTDVFELRGTVTRGGYLRPASVREPTVFFAYALKEGLRQREIDVPGAVVAQRLTAELTPPDALVATTTTPLADILWRCNTFSQNMFAECLLKSLAAYDARGRRTGTQGSWDAGRRVLVETLGQLGLDLKAAEIRDGSGLSHSNRVTAGQIVRLLVIMQRHRYGEAFRATLAEPGRPGSMHTRYDDPLLRRRLRGKTGTISGVRALAGYLTRSDGRVLAFAILVNGSADRDLPEDVCKALLANEP